MKLINESMKWLPIKDYEGIYEISNFGQVKSKIRKYKNSNIQKDFIKKTRLCKDTGYEMVSLNKSGITKYYTIHRLLAFAFLPNPENLPCVNHINGIKTDNSLENLEWCSYSRNQSHAIQTGLCSKPPLHFGHDHHKAKFNPNIFKEILSLRASGVNIQTILKKFNISQTHYYRVVNKKTWKHILY